MTTKREEYINAARKGDLEKFRALDAEKETHLETKTVSGHERYRHWGGPDKSQKARNEALDEALACGRENIALFLLNKPQGEVDINSDVDDLGRTLIGDAALRGNLEIIKLLVEKGVDLEKGAPLSTAAFFGHLNVVKYLIEKGANPNQFGKWERDGALECAIKNNEVAVFNFLSNVKGVVFAPGTLYTAIQSGNVEMVQRALKEKVCLNELEKDFGGVVNEAVLFGQVDVVKFLIEGNLGPKSSDITTPMITAVNNNDPQMVDILLKSQFPFKESIVVEHTVIRQNDEDFPVLALEVLVNQLDDKGRERINSFEQGRKMMEQIQQNIESQKTFGRVLAEKGLAFRDFASYMDKVGFGGQFGHVAEGYEAQQKEGAKKRPGSR